MKSFTFLSGATLSASFASAALWECDAYKRPNWDDCARITEPWRGSEDILHEKDPGVCMLWTDGNCKVAHCFYDGEAEGSITKAYAHQVAGELNFKCAELRAGGQWNSGADYIEIRNDESQRPSKKRRGPPVPKKITIEEWEAMGNATDIDRANVRKREEEGDDVISIDFIARGIRNPDQKEDGPRLGKGVGYTYETENSKTFSVTTTMKFGAGWGLFTAEVGTEISESEEFSIREGLKYDIQCEDQGQVTFWPFYDRYDVTFWPSGSKEQIWVPATYAGKINGEVAVSCLGFNG